MSPTMPTFRPLKSCLSSQMVYRSSSAWVGCWCLPSPASMTCTPDMSRSCGHARMLVAHDDHVDLVGAERFHRIHEALALHRSRGGAAEVQAVGGRRFSAISNEERVRVEGSLNMFTTVKPLSVGTFLMRRSLTCLKRFGRLEDGHDVIGGVLRDVDEVLVIEGHGPIHLPFSAAPHARGCPASCPESPPQMSVDFLRNRRTFSLARRGHVLAHEVGADGQLTVAAVNEDRQLDGGGAAHVHEGVERGADGAARCRARRPRARWSCRRSVNGMSVECTSGKYRSRSRRDRS